MKPNFETFVFQLEHEAQIMSVLKSLTLDLSFLDTRQGPYRFGGSHAQVGKEAVNRSRIFDCTEISIVKNRKSKVAIVRKLPHNCKSTLFRMSCASTAPQ